MMQLTAPDRGAGEGVIEYIPRSFRLLDPNGNDYKLAPCRREAGGPMCHAALMKSAGTPEAPKPASESRLAHWLRLWGTPFRRLFQGGDEVVFESGLPLEALAAFLRRTMRPGWPLFGSVNGPVGRVSKDAVVVEWGEKGQRGSLLVFKGRLEATAAGSRIRGRFVLPLVLILGFTAGVGAGVPALLWNAVRRPEILVFAALLAVVFYFVITSAVEKARRGISEYLRKACGRS